eukprot:1873870-Prymnesium_polylepis.1
MIFPLLSCGIPPKSTASTQTAYTFLSRRHAQPVDVQKWVADLVLRCVVVGQVDKVERPRDTRKPARLQHGAVHCWRWPDEGGAPFWQRRRL